jgi:hypothetical protein
MINTPLYKIQNKDTETVQQQLNNIDITDSSDDDDQFNDTQSNIK